MTIAVLIEPISEGGFRATGGFPFVASAQGATRDEALNRLRLEIEGRINTGAVVVPMEVGSNLGNPWLGGADPLAEIAITMISVEEQIPGWYTMLRNAKQPKELALAYQSLIGSIRFLASLPILPFPSDAIARFYSLLALKLNVGRMDLRIAAIALEGGSAVVTRNRRDFGRVPGLVVEDWSV